MRNMHLLRASVCLGICLGLTTTIANATPFVTVTLAGTNPTDGSGNQATGFSAYIISVLTDNGALVTAIDAGGPNGGPTALTNGFFGPLLQRWDYSSNVLTPSPARTDVFNPATALSIDSHFLITTNRADDVAPQEDNTGINPPGSPSDVIVNLGGNTFGYDYGTGTNLEGTFGLKEAIESNNVAVAYVVLPTGVFGSYALEIATSDPGNPNFHLTGVVPEPVLSPALLAGLGLLRRRRP